MSKPLYFYLLLTCCLPSVILSQEKDSVKLNLFDLSLEELSKIAVFSTTRTEDQPLSEAASNVTVITEKQIKERGYMSLIDILEDIPGFKIDRNVDPRWLHDITLRGVRYMDKIIILQDGVRISSPTNERVPVFDNYPIHYAKQVEIIKGPASALYGADAFSGVINIVTKDQEDNQVIGTINGGIYNAFNTNLFLQKKIKAFHVSIGGSYFNDQQPDLADFYSSEYEGRDEELRSGTFNTIFGPITPSTPINASAKYPLESWSFQGKIDYKKLSISFFTNHAHVPSSTANTPSNSIYNKAQLFGHDIKMITGKYAYSLGKINSTIQTTYSIYDLDEDSNFRNAFTDMEPAFKYANSSKFKVESLFTVPVKSNLKITSGATIEFFNSIPRSGDLQNPIENDRTEEAIVLNSITPQTPDGIAAELIEIDYKNIGVLSQFNWIFDDLNITIGARLDSDDRFDPTFNPRAGIVYSPTSKLTLKSLYGRAYLAPSPQNIYDRFGTFNTADNTSPFLQLPNETLEPQTVSTFEFGGSYFFEENFSLSTSGYYSFIQNLISPITEETNPQKIQELYPDMQYVQDGRTFDVASIQVNDNIGESTVYGGSLEVRYIIPINKFTGDFGLSYSYIDGVLDIDEEGEAIERNLPGVSPHMFRLNGTLSSARLSINVNLQRLSDQRTINPNSVVSENDTEDLRTFTDDDTYQELNGYFLVNAHFSYLMSKRFSMTLSGRNLLDNRYRNVNIGAGPENLPLERGSGEVEFQKGAPQNPIRITVGIQFKFD